MPSLQEEFRAVYDAMHAEVLAEVKPADVDEWKAKVERRIIDSHMKILLEYGRTPSEIAELKALLSKAVKTDKDKELLVEAFKKPQIKLRGCWHPDKRGSFTDAMKYFDDLLGEDHCYKLVDICIDRLINPPAVPDNDIRYGSTSGSDSESMVDAQKIAENIVRKAATAPTYTERFFYKSVIKMMQSTGSYASALHEIHQPHAKLAALLLPLAGTIYCATFFAPQLLLGVVISGFVSRTFNKVEHDGTGGQREVAGAVRHVSNDFYYMILSLPTIVSSINMTISSSVITGMTSSINYLTGAPQPAEVTTNCPIIDSIPLQMIALPLQEYVADQSQQWGSAYREGASKSLLVKGVITEIQKINDSSQLLFDKLDLVEKLLAQVSVVPIIKDSGAQAIAAFTCAKMELERARKSLTSPQEQRYYNAYHGCMLPLQGYVKQYKDQWVSAWRSNAEVVKEIKVTLDGISGWHQHSGDTAARLWQMKLELDLLKTKVELMKKVDPLATDAIAEACEVLDLEFGTTPRARVS